MKIYVSKEGLRLSFWSVGLTVIDNSKENVIVKDYFLFYKSAKKYFDEMVIRYKEHQSEYLDIGEDSNLFLGGESMILFRFPFMKERE